MLNNIDTNISQYAIIFVILSYINHKSYDIVENLLIKKSNKYNTLSENRKLYVQKNFVKSGFIFIFSIYATYALYLPIVYNKWDNFTLHILGLFYSINDIVSLIKVKKLPFTTKLHHIAVTILSLQNIFNDYSKFTFWRALLVYTLLSAYSFSVNMYLAYRIISQEKDKLRNYMCLCAFWTYILCFTFNWVYQLYIASIMFITNQITYIYCLYFLLTLVLCYDDLILIKFLYKNAYIEDIHKNRLKNN